MKLIINALLFMGFCAVIIVSVFVTVMSIYLFKQAKWESELKRFKENEDGTVTDKNGFRITKPSDLLKELQGIEERIAK